jgi:hypothetical protein
MKPLLASFALLAPLWLPQSDKPVAPDPASTAPIQTAPIQNVDQEPAKPGELPKSTSADARERWQKLLAASLAPGLERKPVTAFDLAINLRYRGAEGQRNDLDNARYQWLAPGYIRVNTGRGQTHLRSPRAGGGFSNWFLDTTGDKLVKRNIDIGRDTGVDRRQLNEEANIAGNFAALTDPRSVRILRLAAMPSAPIASLPESSRANAAKLAWLELESPDFFVPRTMPDASPRARVQLGIDPATSLVQLATVADARDRGAVSSSMSVLQLSGYKTVDGFQVPFNILVWSAGADPGTPAGELRLREKPAMDMVLKSASLRASLKPEDFLPDAPIR